MMQAITLYIFRNSSIDFVGVLVLFYCIALIFSSSNITALIFLLNILEILKAGFKDGLFFPFLSSQFSFILCFAIIII